MTGIDAGLHQPDPQTIEPLAAKGNRGCLAVAVELAALQTIRLEVVML